MSDKPIDVEKLKKNIPDRYFKTVPNLPQLLAELQEKVNVFMTQSEADFAASCAFLREERWVYLCVACVSPEPKRLKKPRILNIADGWPVYDFGNEWCLSRGEDMNILGKGRLLTSVFKLFEILIENHVEAIALEGGEYPKRVAFLLGSLTGIEITNYVPTVYDMNMLERIQALKDKSVKLERLKLSSRG